jgi:DUF1365 family protein
MHARSKPVSHRFRYHVFSLLIDLDRLDEADALVLFLGVNRPNLISFHEQDHGDGGATSLATQARELARRAGVEGEIARVELLCYPRVLGYAFNPLSVYYLFDRAGELSCMLYEVHNTFSQRHTYVAKVEPKERAGKGLRQARDKLLYVSPFIDMAMRYEFYLKAPADTLFLRIGERDAIGTVLVATFAAARRRLSAGSLIACCLAVPLLGLKVVGAIHFEALRLWLKGLRPFIRPEPPSPTSFAATGAFTAASHIRDELLTTSGRSAKLSSRMPEEVGRPPMI